MEPSSSLREQIDRFPHAPGVYLMQDADDTIVYVGKAKNLPNLTFEKSLPRQVILDLVVMITAIETNKGVGSIYARG